MRLVKGAPNLMQRLSRLPAAPNVTLLDRRKPKPHPWPHDNTTFIELIYIRWCCIDLSNAPRLSVEVGPPQVSSQFRDLAKKKVRYSTWSVHLCVTFRPLQLAVNEKQIPKLLERIARKT